MCFLGQTEKWSAGESISARETAFFLIKSIICDRIVFILRKREKDIFPDAAAGTPAGSPARNRQTAASVRTEPDSCAGRSR